MAKRPTIADVAAQARVSVATVDRALNGRSRVREETLKRIQSACRAVGYHGAGLIEQRLREALPHYRFGFLLLDNIHSDFYQALRQQLEAAVSAIPFCQGIASVDYLNWTNVADAAKRLLEFGRTVDALAVVSIDHPRITTAVTELRKLGVPVFSLLSDFAQDVRETYVGLNNRKVGRAAAQFIAKTAKSPGRVAIFVASSRFHGHEMREIGFRTYFRERAPQFEVIDTLVNPGSTELARAATQDLLARHHDLVGLNVAGFGPEGVIPALREADTAGRLAVVCNESTADSHAALADDIVTLVINTPLDRLCQQLISHMVRAIQNGPGRVPGQVFVPFDLLISESI